MKVVVITPRALAPVSKSIIDAFKKRDVTVMKLNPGRIDVDLSGDPDFVAKYFSTNDVRGAVVRGIGTSKIKKIYYRLGVIGLFEECGTRVVNSRKCLEIATNKALTSFHLLKAGIHTPKTVVCEGSKHATTAFQQLGGNIVLKPLFGSKGIGVMHLTDEGFASNVFYNLDRMDEVFYIQEYVEHGNSDIRAMVLGNRVLCAMQRSNDPAKKDAWKTNVAVGASGKPIELSMEMQELAVSAARAVGGEFTGVDIVETKDGPSVIEVTAVPGSQELHKTTPIDIAQAFVDHFLSILKSG